jgi:hypothetical protein
VQNSAANLFRSRFFTQPLSCSSPIARFGQHVKIVQLTIGDEEKVQLALEHADIQVPSGNVLPPPANWGPLPKRKFAIALAAMLSELSRNQHPEWSAT